MMAVVSMLAARGQGVWNDPCWHPSRVRNVGRGYEASALVPRFDASLLAGIAPRSRIKRH
jgi:hypothetical protein